MANVQIFYDPVGAMLSSTGIPEGVLIQPGTPASQTTMSGYALATGEFLQFKFRAISYASGNVTVDIDWFARTATTNGAAFSAAIAAITPNTDTGATSAKAYATATTSSTQTVTTTATRLYRSSCVVNNLDSLAIDDYVQVKVARATPTGTDLTGDTVIVLVTVTYLSV